MTTDQAIIKVTIWLQNNPKNDIKADPKNDANRDPKAYPV
jgi:hypothetical protein